MLTFVKLHPEHLKHIRVADVQTTDYAMLTAPDTAAVLSTSLGMSAWASERCVGAAGLVPYWSGRYEAWALLDREAGKHALPILRKMRYVLDTFPARRIEMTVYVDNRAGHRLAEALGFDPMKAVTLEAYAPNGADVVMYSRVSK